MKTKTCTTCGIEKEASREYFHYQKKGLYGFRSRCIPCSREYSMSKYTYTVKPTHKKCAHCKESLPINAENFHKKVTKAGSIIKGVPLKADSHSFRHICIPCWKVDQRKRRRLKLMKKYGCTTEEELDLIIHGERVKNGKKGNDKIKWLNGMGKNSPAAKEYGKKKLKYDYPEGLDFNGKERYRKMKNKGYDNPETYQEGWRKAWLENLKKIRVIPYPDDIKPEDMEAFKNEYYYHNPTPGMLANKLGFKLKDVPQDLLDLKEKQLKLHRTVKKRSHKDRKK